MNALPTLKSLIDKGQQVHFDHYTCGELWYRCDGDTFTFPVPIGDTQNGVFLRDDKAILFMRYIRKHREMLELEMALNQI